MLHKKSVFQGALLTVAMRWSDRLIGLISMVVLARLLTPADFGIIAMSSIVVGLIDVLLDLGVNVALIQNMETNQEDYDTAWTLRLIQASFAGLIIFSFAPMASNYYHNPLITDVLRVMALSVVIAGMENIGVIAFQKNMEFGNDFKFFFYKRVAGFLTTLAGALLLHTYWAMVIGALAGRVTGVLLSYSMHTHRPRFCLSRLAQIWSFSQWVLIRNIGAYLDNRSDKLLVGGRCSADMTGMYSVADEIAAMPTTELLAPLGRVLFPAFVQKRAGPPEDFARSVSTSIGVQALVAIPACIGLNLVASDAVFVLLGAQWTQMVPLIQIMTVTNLVIALIHSGSYALLALGKVKLLAGITWLQTLLFLGVAVVIFPHAAAKELAEIRLAAASLGSLILIGIILSQIEALSAKAFFGPLLRPLLASCLMSLTINTLHPLLANFTPVLRLMLEICGGGSIYLASALLMWQLVGRPDSAEAYLIKNIMRKQ
jgi:O-antigen/teichoic acid export membrane protein